MGRSHHRAYAYLLIPSRKALTGDALKRLEALESLEDLGAGFVLATHDLEIRGAGELLGEEQSGEMTEIGLTMYLDMLDRAVKAMKDGKKIDLEAPLASASEVELRVPALLPEDYVADVHVRLALYKRIAAAPDEAALEELTAELVDRFGPLPAQTQNLLRTARIRLLTRSLGVRRLDFGAHGATSCSRPIIASTCRGHRLIQDRSREYSSRAAKLRVSRTSMTNLSASTS